MRTTYRFVSRDEMATACLCAAATVWLQVAAAPLGRRVHPQELAPPGELRAVVHIGPQKTASTALQRALIGSAGGGRLRMITRHVDHFDVPSRLPGRWGGQMNHGNLAAAIRQPNGSALLGDRQAQAVLRVLREHVSRARDARHHLLLSSELFSSADARPELLVGALLPTHAVHVVLVYRRFFDWAVSMHFQRFRDVRQSPKQADPSRRVLWRRAHQHVPLVGYLSRLLGDADSADRGHWAGTAYDMWSGAAPGARVLVVDFHENTRAPLLTRFVCEAMRARSGCAWLTRSKNGAKLASERRNEAWSGTPMPVVDVVSAAVVAGVIPAQVANVTARHSAMLAVQKRLRPDDHGRHPGGMHGDLVIPPVCLAAGELDRLWRFSLAEERRLVPRGHDATRLRARFDAAVAARLFCSADTAAVLANETWLRVLRDPHTYARQEAEENAARPALEAGAEVLQCRLRWRRRVAVAALALVVPSVFAGSALLAVYGLYARAEWARSMPGIRMTHKEARC